MATSDFKYLIKYYIENQLLCGIQVDNKHSQETCFPLGLKCRPYHHNLKLFTNFEHVISYKKSICQKTTWKHSVKVCPVELSGICKQWTLQQWNHPANATYLRNIYYTAIQHAMLNRLDWLHECRKLGHRYVYMYVHVSLFGGGHATFLWFDFVNKHQIYIDPHMSWDNCPHVHAMQCTALISGVQPVPVSQLTFKTFKRGVNFQDLFESKDFPGICQPLSLLMWLIASRFEYYNFKLIAFMLVSIYNSTKKRHNMMQRFITLFCMYPKSIPVQRLFAPSQLCWAYCNRKTDFCRRPTCPSGVYCWQHYNKYVAGSKKGAACNTPRI